MVPEEELVSSKAWRGGPAGQALVTRHIQLDRKIMPFQESVYTNILVSDSEYESRAPKKSLQGLNVWWVVLFVYMLLLF